MQPVESPNLASFDKFACVFLLTVPGAQMDKKNITNPLLIFKKQEWILAYLAHTWVPACIHPQCCFTFKKELIILWGFQKPSKKTDVERWI